MLSRLCGVSSGSYLYQGIEIDFTIESTNCLGFSDSELSELLKEVYVGEGYIEAEQAEVILEAEAIRSRGKIITASKKKLHRYKNIR